MLRVSVASLSPCAEAKGQYVVNTPTQHTDTFGSNPALAPQGNGLGNKTLSASPQLHVQSAGSDKTKFALKMDRLQ